MAEHTLTDVEVGAPTPPRLFTRLAAEAFGTFVLVLGIVGTATFNAANGGSILTVALAGGIALIAAIAAVGHLSGGHFNPAVTFGLTLAGRARWADLAPYWVAQLVGAAACGALLLLIIPDSYAALVGKASKGEVLASTANGFGDFSPLNTITQGQATFDLLPALVVEILIAAVFVGVILGVTNPRAKIAYPAVVIGLTLGALHIVSWLVTNTSFNPARSLASLVSPDAWGDGKVGQQYWLFVVAPLVGAALAALFARAFAPLPATDELTEGVADPTWDEQPGTAPAAAQAAAVAATATATAAAVEARQDDVVEEVVVTEVVEDEPVAAEPVVDEPVVEEPVVDATDEPRTEGDDATPPAKP
ncbi:aquaporin Z [Isoptericola jiangsuensis]|uniref:Aquaporin Z n=1 Tax=Isoptericola jiangsuensis TaxID=548579 RepID=A0A2A9EVQ7_9MICO|nr:aquaporin [Isoptericola jiangsuensis]PFG42325.1 aquaporin Z [Isoptericola jiangsuensis]